VDDTLFLLHIVGMKKRYSWCFFLLLMGMTSITKASAPDLAEQVAAGIVAGLQAGVGGRLVFNKKTERLEVRDTLGTLIEEMAAGTAGKVVDVSGQEYRLSFGKDDMGRRSVLVRAGPGMQKPITLDIFGKRAVLSTEASLLATLGSNEEVIYEPSICGEVYMICDKGGIMEAVKLKAR